MVNHIARPSLARLSQDPSQRRLRRLSFRPVIEKTIEGSEEEDSITAKVPAAKLHYVQRRREFLVASKSASEKELQELSPVTQDLQEKSLPARQEVEQAEQSKPPPEKAKDIEELPTQKVPASTIDCEELPTLKFPASTIDLEECSKDISSVSTSPLWKEGSQALSSQVEEERQNEKTEAGQATQEQPENNSNMLVVQLGQVEQLQNGSRPRSDQRDLLDPVDPAQRDTLVLSTPKTTTQILGFDDDPEFEKRSTIPMMVLTGISAQQGKSQPEMRSEVSGAAGAAGLMGLGSIIGNILKYVSAFLIQYGFGPGGYGLYTLSLSLINLISATFNLGLDDAMVRYVAIYRGKQQTKSLRGLLIFCTTLAGLAGIAGALLLLFFTPTLVTYWISLKQHHVANKDTINRAIALLQVMAPLIPLMTMQVMWFAGLRGFKAFKWRVLTTGIIQPLLQILLMGLVLLFFRTKDGITAVAVALFISTMVNTVLNLYFLFRQVERVVTPEPERYEVREWLTFASFNFLTTIIDTVLDSIDTILLAAFGVSDVAIGQYGAAIRLGNFIAMPLSSINNVFAPTIAELHSKGEMQKLESMFKLMTKWSVLFSLPIFLMMVLFAPFVLALPGPGFAPAWPLLIAFALGSMINAGTGAVGYMLLMTGYQRISFLNSLVAVTVNIILGVLLTPRYGAMGTAISTGLAICALNAMRLLQVRILLKMHPYNRDVLKPLAAGAISAAVVGSLLYLLSVGHVHAALHIGHAIVYIQLLLVPVFFVSYIALIKHFKGSPEDEFVLRSLRKKFLGSKDNKKIQKVKEI